MIIEAKENDLSLAVPLLREMEQQGLTLGRVNPAHWITSWRVFVNAGQGVVVLSKDDSGQADGLLTGLCSLDTVTGLKKFVVNTGYAKLGHSKLAMPLGLLRRAEGWAKRQGAKVSFVGAILWGERDTVRFLDNAGYKPTEEMMVKGLF